MDLLKRRILQDGKAISSEVLLVDSFLNHQIDAELMREIGREFARIFKDSGATRICTIESSGISPALMTAIEMKLPLVVMKKSVSTILSEELIQTPVHSFTKGTNYQLTVKRRFLDPEDKVLIIDDFLANGEAALGATRVVKRAGADIAGIGIVIEKAFQPGRERLKKEGFEPVSLAAIKHMDENLIEFVG